MHEYRLDRVYARLMRHHPYGWALYKKLTKQDIAPGSCGFFDSDGDWHTLVDLTEAPDTLIGQGWGIPDSEILSNRKPRSMTWGPKSSSSVKSFCLGGEAGAMIPSVPIQASVDVLFENNSEQGAVLITESPVLRHEIDERIALQWMVDNKREMVRRHGQILKKNGIWIVTKTYATRRCAIAIMNQISSSVKLGLKADAQGALTLEPKSSWAKSVGSSCLELHEDDEGVVAFLSGIYFTKKLLSSSLGHTRNQEKQKGRIFRGNSSDSCSSLEDRVAKEDLELDIEFWPPIDEEN